tara:strand:- start:294 stop:1115 length:822 start_codon:yes stop_codon:yes gene_type:complete
MDSFFKILKTKLQRQIVFKFIYKNLYLYELAIFLSRYINFLLPHEEDIYGLNYLRLDTKKNIIDIGASDGLYFKSVRSIGINNKFVSFEPLKINKKYLENIKKKDKNFSFYIAALGNKNSFLNIYTPFFKNHFLYNYSSFSKKESKAILSLRSFNFNIKDLKFKKNKIKQRKLDFYKYKPALLKIDVEGYENEVLLGGIKTIKKYKPIIYVENNLGKTKFNTVSFFLKKLYKFGYKPYIFNFEQKLFFKYNKKSTSGRFFSNNVYFVTKKHLK